uniref:Uncharacterized protein n=1 Tax=Ochrobactrum phage ORM_20 TaxID=2985243 RepID=A0A9N6WWP9_9VIRU|nr:hypothetical protein ORM20_00121 [Ochrobactrum phage ORM_20]
MSREFITKRITSVSVSAFFFVVAIRAVMAIFFAVGFYDHSLVRTLALGLTVSIPLGVSTFVYLYLEELIDKSLKIRPDPYDSVMDAQ